MSKLGLKFFQRGGGGSSESKIAQKCYDGACTTNHHYGAREGVAYCHTRLHLKILANASRWTILWYHFLWEFFLLAPFPARTRLSLKICT